MANLLILEDEVAFGFQLKNDLETAGHEVEVRYSATDAIEELTRTSYDLLISDIIIRKDGRSVPDGGIKLVGWVRSHSEFRELPIIAITGSYKYPGL